MSSISLYCDVQIVTDVKNKPEQVKSCSGVVPVLKMDIYKCGEPLRFAAIWHPRRDSNALHPA